VRGLILCLLVGLFLGSCPGGNIFAQGSQGYTSKRLERPRSALGQPFDAPMFLGAYGQFGGSTSYDMGQPGYGLQFMFRPGRAVNFLSFLYDWNSSLVLQADYQRVTDTTRILSADGIIRRYTHDMRDPNTTHSPFLGVGIGASDIIPPAGSGRVADKYWSLLLEAGQEWNFRREYLLFVKFQFRYYDHASFNYSNFTLQAGAGLPLPW
jgi:hypothetical protein